MPLINSIVKAIMKQQLDNAIIIEEHDGTQYRFNLDSPHPYIENETLEIRVDGLDRNYDLGGGLDTLYGIIITSYMDIPSLIKTPFGIMEHKHWNPVDQYGKKAAAHFFPFHQKGTYHCFELLYPDDYIDGVEEHLTRCEAFRNSEQYAEMAQEYSLLLSKKPNNLESYHTLSLLFLENKHYEKTHKYIQTALRMLESALPSNDVPYILKSNSQPALTYLTLLAMNIHLLVEKNLTDQAMDLAWKVYYLDPYDRIGIRFYIHEITGTNFPEMNTDQNREATIEPYRYIKEYSIPIKDRYNPDIKQNYETWLNWNPYYRYALIAAAHAGHPDMRKMSPEKIRSHLLLHELAETVLAGNEPDSRLLLARLLATGLSRHEAIHEMGHAVLNHYQRSHHHDESCPECGHDSCDHDEDEYDDDEPGGTPSDDGTND